MTPAPESAPAARLAPQTGQGLSGSSNRRTASGPQSDSGPDPTAVGEVLQRAAHDLLANNRALDALTAAAMNAGWAVHRETPLRGGGAVELLITEREPEPESEQVQAGLAVVMADRGATDALRRRLRHLAAHPEVRGLIVVTARPRHSELERTVHEVPVRVVVLEHVSTRPNPSS